MEVRQNSDPVLRRCTIHECDESGVAFRDRAKGTLEDCDVYETGMAAVDVRQNSIPVLRRCKIHDSRQAGVVFVGRSAGTLEDCDVYRLPGAGRGRVAAGQPDAAALQGPRKRPGRRRGVGRRARNAGAVRGQRQRPVRPGRTGGRGTGRASCTITGNADAAVWAVRGAGGSVEDCDLSGNRRGPTDVQGGGVRLQRNRDGAP